MPTSSRRGARRRHIPFALFTAGIALVAFGLTRPTVSFAIPEREGTVILAFDVSNSMRAKDLEPTRIEAAKVAARAFVEKQPRTIKIGVVAFGDSAVTVLKPSNIKPDVIAAINRLSVSGGTSLGQGLFTSLSTIAGKPLTIDESALDSDAGEVKIGFFGSSAIVLLSDGENTSGPTRSISPRSPRPPASTSMRSGSARSKGRSSRSTASASRPRSTRTADEDRQDHRRHATTRRATRRRSTGIYKSIDLEFKRVKKPREVTALFAAAGGLLLALGSLLSIVWLGRVI